MREQFIAAIADGGCIIQTIDPHGFELPDNGHTVKGQTTANTRYDRVITREGFAVIMDFWLVRVNRHIAARGIDAVYDVTAGLSRLDHSTV